MWAIFGQDILVSYFFLGATALGFLLLIRFRSRSVRSTNGSIPVVGYDGEVNYLEKKIEAFEKVRSCNELVG